MPLLTLGNIRDCYWIYLILILADQIGEQVCHGYLYLCVVSTSGHVYLTFRVGSIINSEVVSTHAYFKWFANIRVPIGACMLSIWNALLLLVFMI
jgi:hypothetical protein